jgi:hypothetical protein
MIFAVCSAFFAPLGGWFVDRYGLIPAVRGIYIFGFLMLSAKFIVLYVYSHETVRGVQRMEETRHRSIVSLLREYRSVFGQLLHSRPILAALSLMVITNIYATISNNFWGIIHQQTWLGFTDLNLCGAALHHHDHQFLRDRSTADEPATISFTPLGRFRRIPH